eukprot:TRINITY_DN1408_c0_g1_i1.p1 TRINITY_DN1408_c0_g1~~TRINITY_DN1408_c0_g1_i1.p1  ORF type:complete len:217 (+),score=28.41 TRINITY_DN1408_c0_g1_i1:191-841(+)
MFRNTFQSGFLSILYSIGSKPLQIWDKQVKDGHIKRITDGDIQSSVLEIMGTNVSTTFITCPPQPRRTLGIKLPFLVMIIKNMKKYFTFEVTVLDDKGVKRRFRASNYQSATRVMPFHFALCRCVWTMGGIRFNSTLPTLQGERMAQTILRLFACKSTQIAGFDEFTSPIGFTLKMNSRLSSNCSCQFKIKCEKEALARNIMRQKKKKVPTAWPLV